MGETSITVERLGTEPEYCDECGYLAADLITSSVTKGDLCPACARTLRDGLSRELGDDASAVNAELLATLCASNNAITDLMSGDIPNAVWRSLSKVNDRIQNAIAKAQPPAPEAKS